MFKRAVICTDLSPSSESLIACAGALGAIGVQEAVLAYVIDIGAPGAGMIDGSTDAAFARQAEAIERAGIRVHVDTTVGYPPYAIEQIAEQHDASLIVIGSHGKGLFVSAFSGSVSSDLVRISARPVLLAVLSALGSNDESSAVCGRLLSRVLFPTDLTAVSAMAANYLVRLAPHGLGTVDIVHVVDNTVGNGIEFRRCDAQERLAVLEGDLLAAGAAAVTTEVLVGSPERETARRCAMDGHSMIVMAPRCDEDPGHPLGGVTHAVIQSTHTPVLLIPPGCRR
ncbi:MAG: hypothetical protein CVT59_02390 [Actinobacteria bacterium HGW-Actinobacteria-1]|nr:MAG: hypothetical protein CVT59_02390 [Actinobacteria bacterium HGW-Actinobacteria-1]